MHDIDSPENTSKTCGSGLLACLTVFHVTLSFRQARCPGSPVDGRLTTVRVPGVLDINGVFLSFHGADLFIDYVPRRKNGLMAI